MAVRQYIGARYVIKIYENSVDPASAEWEQGNFDPLVLVTWQNGSYLSKKEVPGSVGNPADNPSYWVQTGFYNGQIASLQSQIDDINNNKLPAVTSAIQTLTKLHQRKFLFVGDSYGDNPAVPTTWGAEVAAALNLDSSQWDNLCRAAYNWCDLDNLGRKYLREIQEYTGDKYAVTDIVIAAGINDTTATYEQIIAAMQEFSAYAKTNYPNAKIWCGWIGFGVSLMGTNNIYRAYNAYKSCGKAGMAYMANLICANHDYNHLIDNNFHPDATADQIIGCSIASILAGGTYESEMYTSRPWEAQTLNYVSVAAGNEFISSEGQWIHFENDNIHIKLVRQLLGYPSLIDINFETDITLAYINSDIFRPKDKYYDVLGSLSAFDDNGVWQAIMGQYRFLYEDGVTKIIFHSTTPNVSNVRYVMMSVDFDYPLIMC